MHRIKAFLLMVMASSLLLGCANSDGSGAQELDINAFEKRLENTSDGILLDVRTPSEYRAGHLPGATLMDIQGDDFREHAAKLDRTKPVMVYCAKGIRTQRAIGVLKELGFSEIYELEGGYNRWVASGKPVEEN